MNSIELTDIDGDAVTIINRGDFSGITCTSGRDEVTVGPVLTARISESALQMSS